MLFCTGMFDELATILALPWENVETLLLTHELAVFWLQTGYGHTDIEKVSVGFTKDNNNLTSSSYEISESQFQRDWCHQYWRSKVASKVFFKWWESSML